MQAEMDAGCSTLTQGEIDALVIEFESDVDAAAGWPEELGADSHFALLHWRAARLLRALVRGLGEVAEAEPALSAACDAAALTVVLLGYRQARELSLSHTDSVDGGFGVPETSLQTAIKPQGRISDILFQLAS